MTRDHFFFGKLNLHITEIKTRIIQALFFLFISFLCMAASASKYQDWWWNPALDGMGINIGHQDNMLLVSWYLYGEDGQATFLTFSGELKNNRLDGELIRSTGPIPGASFNPAEVQRVVVGSASLVFISEQKATFTYNYETKNGTIDLQRFTYKDTSITGSWRFAGFGISSNCYDRENNGSVLSSGTLTLTKVSDDKYYMQTMYDNGFHCIYSFTASQAGSILFGTGNGTLECNMGRIWKGAFQVKRIRIAEDALFIDYSSKVTSGEKCYETGKMSAVR